MFTSFYFRSYYFGSIYFVNEKYILIKCIGGSSVIKHCNKDQTAALLAKQERLLYLKNQLSNITPIEINGGALSLKVKSCEIDTTQAKKYAEFQKAIQRLKETVPVNKDCTD